MDLGLYFLFGGLVMATVTALVAGLLMARFRKVLLGLAGLGVLPLLAAALLIRQVSLDESLAAAAMQGNIPDARRLLSQGANAESVSAGGMPILICAIRSGNKEIVELLIRLGADPNIDDGMGHTALHIAEEQQLSEIAALLRNKGAR